MPTDPNQIQLTAEQRELLAQKADETGRPWAELLEEFLASPKPKARKPRPGRSFLDAMMERGMVGAMEGPGDLSTNPKHMEGFGESRGEEDAD